MPTDLLTTMLQRLDEPQAELGRLDQYYAGKQPLAYLSRRLARPSVTGWPRCRATSAVSRSSRWPSACG
ncbi:hypothetical protein [Mariniluteicoccus flavus]